LQRITVRRDPANRGSGFFDHALSFLDSVSAFEINAILLVALEIPSRPPRDEISDKRIEPLRKRDYESRPANSSRRWPAWNSSEF